MAKKSNPMNRLWKNSKKGSIYIRSSREKKKARNESIFRTIAQREAFQRFRLKNFLNKFSYVFFHFQAHTLVFKRPFPGLNSPSTKSFFLHSARGQVDLTNLLLMKIHIFNLLTFFRMQIPPAKTATNEKSFLNRIRARRNFLLSCLFFVALAKKKQKKNKLKHSLRLNVF